MSGYLFAILGLSVLIVVHELGHMLLARAAGMRVEKFSVGFGPVILRWKKGETTYQIALFPLGGFVQIAGMNPNEKLPEGDPGSYMNKPLWARFATIFAGPLTNYLLAMLLMIVVMLNWGLPQVQLNQEVTSVTAGSPAAKAGLQPGDRITKIDGKKVDAFVEIQHLIETSKGKSLEIVVERGKTPHTLVVKPKRHGEVYRIGFSPGYSILFIDVTTAQAFGFGVLYPIEESRRFLASLAGLFRDLFSKKKGAPQVGGPVEIIYQLKLSFEAGVAMALKFLAMLSAFLGLFNLLPVPALDGGRLLFLLTTMIMRRPINQRFENIVHTVGFVLLLALIVMVTYCDIARRVVGP